jgi:hypothetical protein
MLSPVNSACPGLSALQADLSRALLDGNAPVPAEIRDAARFAIHRNTVFVGLIEALRSTFPVVERLVGEDFFRATARVFAASHPPQSPVLAEYGDGFADFLEGFEPARELPYLADAARLEWLQNLAFQAPDRAALPLSALAATPSEDAGELSFEFHPSAGLMASAYPIVTIWRANTHDAEVRFIGPDLPGEAALVIRPALTVLTLPLTLAEHGFVSALMCGKRLRDTSMAEAAPVFARLISTGAFCGFGKTTTKD